MKNKIKGFMWWYFLNFVDKLPYVQKEVTNQDLDERIKCMWKILLVGKISKDTKSTQHLMKSTWTEK